MRHNNIRVRGFIQGIASVVYNEETKQEELTLSQWNERIGEHISFKIPFEARDILIERLSELSPKD